uniref:Glutathione S-transferase C-terminal domain-containing protein n=1 Tax=Odontella aurita TaxID=265563 RepID=A0A6U6LAD8_9STRA|mmetsp:Transcript_7536/g.22088  ORF Transcript_7536/g.22088 Transcript_7536/m.22088 type:complete len:180 (+) Transcript_7536:389-928(+)
MTEYVAERYQNEGSGTLLPPRPEDRAKVRLFQELCGPSFAYLGILRAPSLEVLEVERAKLQDRLISLNTFLASSAACGPFLCGDQFTLAECYLSPFLQRSCSILPKREEFDLSEPPPLSLGSLHPLDICSELGLAHTDRWICGVLSRPSVQATCPLPEEMDSKKGKLLKRIARLSRRTV